ncbi:MAG: double-strand break repair helicase AddA [Proteobacteria bacterium]|nr:double-strand break repair helicase AddA [Pseudomonadota bacterium]
MSGKKSTSRIRQRTAQQIAAAAPAASVWVSANAGTGKTGVLVDRISRLLLVGVRPGKILCLTFTKAAAAEMAVRLQRLLSDWSAMPEPDLAEELTALGEAPADADLTARARRLFGEMLEAPDGLRIRTIHSFCESLLGRFPLEARITPDFKVMDERSQRELQTEARDRMLAGAESTGAKLIDALHALAGLVDETGFAGLIAELDTHRAKFRTALNRFAGADGLTEAVEAALGLAPGETADDILAKAAKIEDWERAALVSLIDAWDQGADGNRRMAATARQWLAMPAERRQGAWHSDYAGLFLKADGLPKAERTLLSKGALQHDPDALAHAGRIIEKLLAVQDRLKAANTAAGSQALIRIGEALIDVYEHLKSQHGALDYDDLIERTSALLSSPGGASWVHYKLDGGIEHVLVDEAQDTSRPQWQVIDGLAAEFHAGLGRHEETSDRPRTVFAVGDEKQSIYSFQGADPALFSAMRDRFGGRVAASGQTWRPVELAESFRSAPAILKLVDAVFANAETAKGVRFGDGEVHHVWARKGQSGRIELWPHEERTDDDDKGEPWDAPVDYVGTDSPEGRVAARIADTIRGWLDSHEVLPAQGRPVRAGDVLILVQKRKQFAELMVKELKKRDIPVAGRDRMILTDQLAIQDLLAVAKLALLAEDDLNTAVVLKGPLIEFDEDQLFDLANGRSGPLIAALAFRKDEQPAFAWAMDRIGEWRRRADYMPPFEFFSEILGPDQGRARLTAHLGRQASEPIDDFLAAALDFERQHVPSLQGFVHWMETGASEVKRDLELGRDEVRVMTVHGAKGLQSEIVILADACTLPAGQNLPRVRWFGADALPVWPGIVANETADLQKSRERIAEAMSEEYRRLLYVALTRAKDRLYVTGFTGKRGSIEGSWYEMVETALKPVAAEVSELDGRRRLVFEEAQSGEPDGDGAGRPGSEEMAPPVPDWISAERPEEAAPHRPISPSRPEGDEPPVRSPIDADDRNRFKRGLLVHALLQSLPDVPSGERGMAAERYLAAPAHGLDFGLQTEIAAEVMRVLGDPALADAFGPGSLAEVPVIATIQTTTGQRVISGQIDRLAIRDGRVLIVDFKTNRPAPTTPEQVAPIYLRQMASYRAALRLIYPQADIGAILLWTDGPAWMQLPDELLDRHAP